MMVWTGGGEVELMQRVENRVWRQILGSPGYTRVAALHLEIGALTVRGMDMKIKITFARYMFRMRNGLLEGLLEGWMNQLGKYMGE